MKLEITYNPNTSGSLGNAQRIIQEINTEISTGLIPSSVSSSLLEDTSGELKVVLNGTCCIYSLSYNMENRGHYHNFPETGSIALDVRKRVAFDVLHTSCFD